jgi:hypothetical protein
MHAPVLGRGSGGRHHDPVRAQPRALPGSIFQSKDEPEIDIYFQWSMSLKVCSPS